jgi:nitroimidazol reductase NimA-like FMN-containing flavoprotein (pyridoxamine 5'-phosphate oxidase superfamily)
VPPTLVPDLRELDEQECRNLLKIASFGRIAVTERALPMIVPVLFTVQDDTVVAVSPAGSRAIPARKGAIVTLEIDSYQPGTAEGWCVTVIGPAALVSDPADMAALDSLGLAPWAAPRRHYIRIAMARVTGRQLVSAATSTNAWGA